MASVQTMPTGATQSPEMLLQVLPPPQVPQLLPHPSSPQALSVQSGVQVPGS